jgi:hypothetical protein
VVDVQVLQRMGRKAASQLAQDLGHYAGEFAQGMSRNQFAEITGLPNHRAHRVVAYIARFGLDPDQVMVNLGLEEPDDSGLDAHIEKKLRKQDQEEEVHLVIPDVHAQDGVDLRYFTWLGRMEADLKPTWTIQLGDWYDLPSLFEDNGKKMLSRCELRLHKDIVAGEEAVRLFEKGAGGRKQARKFLLGNHDDRIKRIGNERPWLEGIVDIEKEHRAHGWEVHGFLDPVRLGGIRYSHYLCRQGTDKAIAGVNHAKALLERVRYQESVTVGHSHRFDYRIERLGENNRHALVAGCAFEHHEEYAGEDNFNWSRMVAVKRNVRNGDYDLELWSMKRIRSVYGD